MAYSHLFFNLTGIFLFYTIWPMRQLPIRAAKFMGNTTAEYRWFALALVSNLNPDPDSNPSPDP